MDNPSPKSKAVDNSTSTPPAIPTIGAVLNGNPKPGAPWFASAEGVKREAEREGVSSPPGEKLDDLKTRVFAVKAARQRNAQA